MSEPIPALNPTPNRSGGEADLASMRSALEIFAQNPNLHPNERKFAQDVLDGHWREAPVAPAIPTEQTTAFMLKEIADVITERDFLRDQVTALQTEMSSMVCDGLPRMVREFHFKYGQPVLWAPAIPAETRVRFRLRLITEEYLELMSACFDLSEDRSIYKEAFRVAERNLGMCWQQAPIEVDFPELMDACGDLDYVVEGTRAEFGVDGRPIIRAIHVSNMAKDYALGKPTKPLGWAPPDVRGLLCAQGWGT